MTKNAIIITVLDFIQAAPEGHCCGFTISGAGKTLEIFLVYFVGSEQINKFKWASQNGEAFLPEFEKFVANVNAKLSENAGN